MSTRDFAQDAKVMPDSQVTIPKSVPTVLGLESGNSLTFVVEDNAVHIVNPALYALMRLQEQMQGEADRVGLSSEETVAEWITESRRAEN